MNAFSPLPHFNILAEEAPCWRELPGEGKRFSLPLPCRACQRVSTPRSLPVQVASEPQKLPSSPMCPTQPVRPHAPLQPPACLSCSQGGHHSWGLS